jgi:hypothetical protein
MNTMNYTAGHQPGSAKTHAVRASGKYPSGNVRYVKVCGTRSTDRAYPYPSPEATIDCKRCLASIAR